MGYERAVRDTQSILRAQFCSRDGSVLHQCHLWRQTYRPKQAQPSQEGCRDYLWARDWHREHLMMVATMMMMTRLMMMMMMMMMMMRRKLSIRGHAHIT